MTTTTSTLDREAWLTEAAALIQQERIQPNLPTGHHIAHPYRVSVGYAPRSRAGKVIAVCVSAEASADGHNEIFVTPAIDDSIAVLAALTHELIHQADNNLSGHKGFFKRMAKAVGFHGKATTAGAQPESYQGDLHDYLKTIVDLLDNIPHAKIDLDLAKKKQTSRMLKVTCPACDFTYRTSRKNVDMIADWSCPACHAHMFLDV